MSDIYFTAPGKFTDNKHGNLTTTYTLLIIGLLLLIISAINGATMLDILLLFNKKFIWMIVVCFIIALPVAWYSVEMWLQNFEYRVSLYWWIFAVALLMVLIITLTTVTIQSWSSAKENPINSLKGE